MIKGQAAGKAPSDSEFLWTGWMQDAHNVAESSLGSILIHVMKGLHAQYFRTGDEDHIGV